MLLAASVGLGFAQSVVQTPHHVEKWKGKTMYSIETRRLDGTAFDLAQFKGKVVVVVNVASKCGYTPQYVELQKLYDEMKPKGVVVIGVPSNDFGGQEPGTPKEIESF
ncbi:MAG: redoxin domain-containing protein, partial [Phycisphaerales bacterium]|nr:redoxin domain-containing protein [Phycisphaerales bacterium]